MAARALVTGAAGFVGRHLSHYLRAQSWDVVGCDRAASEDDDILACDIADRESVEALLDSAGEVTHVFHLAAIANPREAKAQRDLAQQINVQGTQHLVESVYRRWPRARFVFVSSSQVYGKPERLPITEDHPLDPATEYGATKAKADTYCREQFEEHGWPIVRMRPFNHSGPNQRAGYVLPDFAQQIAQIKAGVREPVISAGAIDREHDIAHVADVVRAYELAALEGTPGEVYNVCSGESHLLRAALERMMELAGVEAEVESRSAADGAPRIVGSYDRLNKATGWHPEHSFDELLRDVLNDWMARVETPAS